MPLLRQYCAISTSLSGAVSSTTLNLSALDHRSLVLPLPGMNSPALRALRRQVCSVTVVMPVAPDNSITARLNGGIICSIAHSRVCAE
jgi:hypothetical protein